MNVDFFLAKQTLSTLVDSHHFCNKDSHYEKTGDSRPGIARRISGIALTILSALPLGMPLIYFSVHAYWKAKGNIEEKNTYREKVVSKVFDENNVEVEKKKKFNQAIKAVQYGNQHEIKNFLSDFGQIFVGKSQSEKAMQHLVNAALEYDDVKGLEKIVNQCSQICVNFYSSLIKSKEMLDFVKGKAGENAFNQNDPDEEGNGALHAQNNLEIVSEFLKLDANVAMQNKEEETPLHLCKDPVIARALIDYLCFGNSNDLDVTWVFEVLFLANSSNKTALEVVPERIKKAMVDQLTLNFKNSLDGNTPLFYALTKDQAKILIEAGCDPEDKNNNGENALFGEISHEVVNFLVEEKGLDRFSK